MMMAMGQILLSLLVYGIAKVEDPGPYVLISRLQLGECGEASC